MKIKIFFKKHYRKNNKFTEVQCKKYIKIVNFLRKI